MRHCVLLVVVFCGCATVSSRTREAMRAGGSTETLTSTPPGERITPADDGLARARLFAVGAVQALAKQALLLAPAADGKVPVNAETYGLDVGFFLAAAVNERLVEQGLAAATWAPKVKVRFEGGVERLPEAVPVNRAQVLHLQLERATPSVAAPTRFEATLSFFVDRRFVLRTTCDARAPWTETVSPEEQWLALSRECARQLLQPFDP